MVDLSLIKKLFSIFENEPSPAKVSKFGLVQDKRIGKSRFDDYF